jgi:DNA-binding NarL/FixJ family response regulator
MRIFIVSAYPTVRAGLRVLAQERGGWSVVGEASPAAPPMAGAEPVDVLLVDLESATSVASQLATLVQMIQPRAGVVAIGAAGGGRGAAPEPGTEAFTDPLGALGALGVGLLPRDATAEEITAAIEAAARGLIVVDRGTARRLLASANAPASAPAASSTGETPLLPGEALTAREREVLQLLAEGLPNKLIASRLQVSEHTAKFHVASIMTKLGAASRTEAVTLAARRGLLVL